MHKPTYSVGEPIEAPSTKRARLHAIFRDRLTDGDPFPVEWLYEDDAALDEMVNSLLDAVEGEYGSLVDEIIAQRSSFVEPEPCCCAVSPDPQAYDCTREVGHEGDHVAQGSHGDVLSTWPSAVSPLPSTEDAK